ncbi:hypothetical protein SEA_ZUCKER_36 [Arthrobacter phage Zucker]|nr:hypothetical protein SEA_ZUCKER_36 [Arthrobacter phage Zucker]
MSARDELAQDIRTCPTVGSFNLADPISEHLYEMGYRKPRIITTTEEANDLPDRSAILTPGQIIFRKWEDYYGDGKHAWERELGQVVPAELLSDDDHFPAIVLHEPEAKA